MNRRSLPTASLALSLVLLLGGCSDKQPTADEMGIAVRSVPNIAFDLAFMFGEGQRVTEQEGHQLAASLTVEKLRCAAAQGQPGYDCEFRFHVRKRSGQPGASPFMTSRFVRSDNGWSTSLRR